MCKACIICLHKCCVELAFFPYIRTKLVLLFKSCRSMKKIELKFHSRNTEKLEKTSVKFGRISGKVKILPDKFWKMHSFRLPLLHWSKFSFKSSRFYIFFMFTTALWSSCKRKKIIPWKVYCFFKQPLQFCQKSFSSNIHS